MESQDTISETIPPPVMGWNTRDPISQMDPTYAVEIENYFPNFGTVDVVNGYRYHSKSIGSGVVTAIAEFAKPSASGSTDRYLLAAGSDKLVYNATTASAAATDITTPSVLSGKVRHFQQFNDRIFMTTDDPNDNMYYWTGPPGLLTACTWTDDTGTPLVTSFGAMGVYKNRFYVCDPKHQYILYGKVEAISGVLTQFKTQSIFRFGGKPIFVGTVTRAKDFSEDALLAIVSNQGEILVYSGSYPGGADWNLVGQYLIPRPLGPKAFFYIGANLCIITAQGLLPMSEIMGGTQSGRYLTLSDTITSAFTEAATSTLLEDYYWCGVNYPRGNFAVCNIPVSSGVTSNQFYMNTTNQAWSKRSNQNAFCWCLYNDDLYFGGLNGKVFKAHNGYFDEDPSNEGQALSRTAKLRPAYNYFGNRQTTKGFQIAVPIVYESEGLALNVDADVDFANSTPSNAVTDLSDTSYKIYRPAITLTGQGKCASVRFQDTHTTKRRSIQAIDVFWTEGGNFG